jgi:hypothetical protein
MGRSREVFENLVVMVVFCHAKKEKSEYYGSLLRLSLPICSQHLYLTVTVKSVSNTRTSCTR